MIDSFQVWDERCKQAEQYWRDFWLAPMHLRQKGEIDLPPSFLISLSWRRVSGRLVVWSLSSGGKILGEERWDGFEVWWACVPGWRQGRGPSWRWDPAHQGLPFHTWQKQVMLFQGSFFRQITWTLQGHGRTPSCPSGTPAPRAPPLKRFHRYSIQLKEMFNVSEILPIKTNNSFDNVSNSNYEVLSTNEFPLSKLDIVITQHQPQNHHYPHHCHWYCHHCDCHCHCHRQVWTLPSMGSTCVTWSTKSRLPR